MGKKIIRVAEDFSRYPAGRYLDDGPFSGAKFREDFLKPIIDSGEHVIIDLDGARGYGSSFLEEAFGGLVREGIEPEKILETFEIRSSDKSLIYEIEQYVLNGAE